jgi:hypothetical protein
MVPRVFDCWTGCAGRTLSHHCRIWVASEHIGSFTNTAPLQSPAGEIPPTGRRAELQIAEVYQMKDGKLALLRAYYDVATMLRQLGVMS